MKTVLRIALDNPVLLNLLFAIVVLGGIAAYSWLPKEQFPQVEVDRIAVITAWPGAAPEDIEDLVVRPLEEAVERVDGLKHVYAEAISGRSTLTLEFVRGTDTEEALRAVEREIGTVDDLPEDALSPRSVVVRVSVPIIKVALMGDLTRVDLAERLADELSGLPGVKEVELQGAAEPVVRVDLDPARLRARNLDPGQVAAAIRAAGTGAPAGELEMSGQRVLVRTDDRLTGIADVADVPIDATGRVRVGDVAQVYTDWEDPTILRHVDGLPAITMVLFRTDAADSIDIAHQVDDWVEERRDDIPSGLVLRAFDDSSQIVSDRLRIVLSNGFVGIGLVAICLVIFIGWRNAGLVVWGMPVAYLGAVGAMYLTGVSINVISTFGLLLVTGIIVDDAVVIVENVQRYLEQGQSRLDAALNGAWEVIPAVAASTLTTCLAFGPLMLLEGTVGRVMGIIPQVVIFSLLASLLEAFVILPGHLGHYAKEAVEGENRLTRWLKRAYRPVLERVTRPWIRYATLLALLVGFAGVMSLTMLMRTSLQTPGKPYYALYNVDLPPSASTDETRAALARLEAAVRRDADGLVAWMQANTGRQADPSDFPTDGPQYGQLKVGFVPDPDVFAQVPGAMERIRQHLETDPALVSYGIVELQGGPPVGRDIDVRVRSRDPEQVMPVVQALEDHLDSREGVRDIQNEAGEGAEEFRVKVDPQRAARFGLREAQVALAARAALDGELALELPIDERSTEVRVGVRGARRTDLEGIRDLPLSTPTGDTVRLRQVARVERTRGVEKITRVDGQRAVRLSALVDPDVTTAEEEQADLQAAFEAAKAEHPDVDLFLGGQLADTNESFSRLPVIFALAMVLIYGVLAVQFKSYAQPFIIVAAIPLGLAGVVLGLFTFGMDLSLIAMIGAVGLSGIVVNDSLVLIDFVNRRVRDGMEPLEAVRDAALTRLRPILITTITTVLGLLPLALGIAGSEPLLAPMAVSISFGLAFATALTLIAIPVLYLIVEDLTSLGTRLFRGKQA